MGSSFPWRALAVFAGPPLEAVRGAEDCTLGGVEELSNHVGGVAEVRVLHGPSLEEFRLQLQAWRPNLVYVYGGYQQRDANPAHSSLNPLAFQTLGLDGRLEPLSSDAFAELFLGLELDAVFLDAGSSQDQAGALCAMGVPNAVYWPSGAEPNALVAAQFAHSFFATLRLPTATVPEAFALACHVVQAHFKFTDARGGVRSPMMPQMYSPEPPALPSCDTVPGPAIEGWDPSQPLACFVPGWENVRLVTPCAELKLQPCGTPALVDMQRLMYLGEALRAIAVFEARSLTVLRSAPSERVPAHLPCGCGAVAVEVQSGSGAVAAVLLGGPPAVLANPALLEHALRLTLAADALHQQLAMPPPGAPLPEARAAPAPALGTPVVEVQLLTSLWAVSMLTALAQAPAYRGLAALGIAGVGTGSVAGLRPHDAARFGAIIAAAGDEAIAAPLPLLGPPVAAPVAAGGAAAGGVDGTEGGGYGALLTGGADAGGGGGGGVSGGGGGGGDGAVGWGARPSGMGGGAGRQTAAHAGPGGEGGDGGGGGAGGEATPTGLGAPAGPGSTGGTPSTRGAEEGEVEWHTDRPPLAECSEEQFYADLIAFLSWRHGKRYDPATFPEAVLNQRQLDLFNLYREVTQRGGIRAGNSINWKGQVFPNLTNFTDYNRMTGVGNALKRHYTYFLSDYEAAHPEDVSRDVCQLCGRGDNIASDWLQCSHCGGWVHLSCDARPGLGTYKDYVRGAVPDFLCGRCLTDKHACKTPSVGVSL